MIILGIESTCDETAAAVVEDGKKILSNIIRSQVDIHKKFGGVFPEVASRNHLNMIMPVIQEAMDNAHLSPEDIDAIAIANGPGLMGSLLIGMNTAKALSLAWNKPLIGVNHIEAHLYSAMMPEEPVFPALGVILSGGHTVLVEIADIKSYKIIGRTIDDAIGEAFDKVATMLGLGYPGGPAIEAISKQGDPNAYAFAAGKCSKSPYNFSFSGLKTKVLYTAKGQKAKKEDPLLIGLQEIADIAASFQQAVYQDVISKIHLALEKSSYKTLYLGGGVTNSKTLRAWIDKAFDSSIKIFWPPKDLSMDNAAMIAGLAYHNQKITFAEPIYTRMPLVK